MSAFLNTDFIGVTAGGFARLLENRKIHRSDDAHGYSRSVARDFRCDQSGSGSFPAGNRFAFR